MTNYQVVCRTLSDDQSHIVKMGLINDGGDPSKADFPATPKELNSLLQKGNKCYFTTQRGQTAEVIPYGDDHVTTTADGTVLNNLRHLRGCRGFSS